MSRDKKTWTDKFHPDNGRISTLKKVRKLSDESLSLWIAHGIMAAAALRNSTETYVKWGSFSDHYHRCKKRVLLREWAAIKLAQLENEREERIYHSNIL